jgi:CRP/FNR family nitrogen fixation transcriptional regulator
MRTSAKSRMHSGQISDLAYRHALANRPHPLRAFDALAVIMQRRRGEEICRRGMPADYWYLVISGVARRCAIRADGRRQIVDLLLPGDFFGFASDGESDVTVEAAEEVTAVAAYPCNRIENLAASNPSTAREIRRIADTSLSRLQAQLLILGRVTALQKVGAFILQIAARLSDGDTDKVALPVSRYDIADYLGLSVETVSRSISNFQHRGAIKLLDTRTVNIVDRDALMMGRGARRLSAQSGLFKSSKRPAVRPAKPSDAPHATAA